jgi:pyruvate kinase
MQTALKVKTKIVATLGPSCNEVAVIEKMLKAGLSVARVNMSHGDHVSHTTAITNARLASLRSKIPVAILQDLAGPKIRLGDFTTETVTLENGSPLTLTTKPCVGTVSCVHITYAKLPQEVQPGMAIYLNDGKQKLVVKSTTETEIHTTIVNGGTIRGRRGVNIPDADLSISSLTPKDRKDLVFGVAQEVDFITLSFVRTASDIHLLRKLIKKQTNRDIAIVAKIETKSAIENIDEIIEATDVVMVARGDLAIEMPPEKVPLLQKKIISLANRLGKPVITATQMLDSMRTEVTPTRAEVSDIANAIIDGTDALMLSDETAVGKHPERPIEVMSRVAREVESDAFFTERHNQWDFDPTTVYEAVGQSIVKTARTIDAKAIVTFSESGYTSKMIIRYRPRVSVLVLTPHQTTFNQSLVAYACVPYLIKDKDSIKNLNDAQKIAREALVKTNLAGKGDVFVLAAGVPFGSVGATNMMLVEHV